jgi:hypothetical protein
MESTDAEGRDARGDRPPFRFPKFWGTGAAVAGDDSSDPYAADDLRNLEPVHEHDGEPTVGIWTRRLVIFLRVMAGVSLLKGLYHWSRICGVGVSDEDLYVTHAIAWQTATVFFAVIDLVAAVGLWLAAWGAVIWLTAVASMIAVQLFFPQVFGRGMFSILFEAGVLAVYLMLALKAAREQPV